MQGGIKAILDSGPLPNGVSERGVHRVRLDCTWGIDASVIEAWIDGTKIGPVSDRAWGGNNILRSWAVIGFWAMSPSVPAVVTIDNVVITTRTQRPGRGHVASAGSSQAGVEPVQR